MLVDMLVAICVLGEAVSNTHTKPALVLLDVKNKLCFVQGKVSKFMNTSFEDMQFLSQIIFNSNSNVLSTFTD